MTILFVGAEDCDASYRNGMVFDTSTGGTRRTSYVRGCFAGWGQDPGALDPNPGRVTFLKWSAAASSFWVSFQYKSMVRPGNGTQVFVFRDGSGVSRLILRGTGGTTYKLSKRSAVGTITDIGTFSAGDSLFSNLTKVDINVNYSSSGSVALYYDGVLQSTVSGNLLTDSATDLQQFEAGAYYWYGDGKMFISEVIVSTADTRAMSLATLTSSTAGAAQYWTGIATNVNQASLTDDSLYIYTTGNNSVQQYKPGPLPSGNFSVKAVVHSARALVGATGPQHLAFVTRVGSTDYDSADYAPANSFGGVQHIQETNPSTSSAWAVADLASANLQYGVKSKA